MRGNFNNVYYESMVDEFAAEKARKLILYNYLILFIIVYVKYKKRFI